MENHLTGASECSRAGATAAHCQECSRGDGQGMICQVLGDHDPISGSLLLKGEHFILLFTPRGMKVQRWWQGMGTALPTHGFPAR